MHIPDGYLSPATCAVMYAGAAPFWYVALRKVRKAVHTQTAPLLSLAAAFSFVVMMFNLPLPGGTTGHAVGVGIASIVLGPWGSILAISTALVVQALFFGDGGITALGANCFNMAIVGSLTAYAVYRATAGRSPIDSKRRVVAAAVAGYTAINLSALCAALEFGIQPALYHDAYGAPLYAPYPLHIAIPAMMIGHLTIAGLAELVISAGVLRYLQRAEPELLRTTAPGIIPGSPPATGRYGMRPLWIALGFLMIVTPLGILAAGTAWGEWTPSDFSNPAMRQHIAAASQSNLPPGKAPQGMARLAGIWTAPMPAYAPPFMKSQGFGYLLSAMLGTGLIILTMLFFSRIFDR